MLYVEVIVGERTFSETNLFNFFHQNMCHEEKPSEPMEKKLMSSVTKKKDFILHKQPLSIATFHCFPCYLENIKLKVKLLRQF